MRKGQSLIEALVALGAAVVVVSAITVTVMSSLSNVEFSRDQNLATQYSQQGLEFMRQVSQGNWVLFSSYVASRYCLAKDATAIVPINPATNTCGQNYGNFIREVDIEQNSQSCSGNVKTTVIVSWSDGKCTDINNKFCHNVTLYSCLSNASSNIQIP